jgi:hypothetical protein
MLTSRGHGSAAWDGRSFLGSSQPGTRTPSQSGLRHQVIELTAAPGRSPSCCIPLTDLDCNTGDGKRQERKFLKGPPGKSDGRGTQGCTEYMKNIDGSMQNPQS